MRDLFRYQIKIENVVNYSSRFKLFNNVTLNFIRFEISEKKISTSNNYAMKLIKQRS